MQTTVKNKIAVFFLFSFSVVFMLLLCEWGLRFIQQKGSPAAEARLLRRSSIPGLGWELTPGFQSEKYSINAAGFRGPSFSVEKTGGVQRIACIGDSHCFGLGIYDKNKIYPALLQQRLAANDSLEVLNFGVPGYNTWQEFSQLQEIVLHYKPDRVVLGFVFNDADGNTAIETADGRQKFAETSAAPVPKSYTSWLKQSYLVMALKEVFERAALAFFDYHPNYIDIKIKTARWREMKAKLSEMDALLKNADIPLLVIVFPMTYQLAAPESESAAQRDILTFLKKQKIAHINLFPRFRRFLHEHKFDYKKLTVKGIRDSHPTATGHLMVAEAITDYLQNEK